MNFFKKPFGYEPVLTKEDLKAPVKKKKQPRANDWKNTLRRIWEIVDEQRALLILVFVMVIISSGASLLGPFLIGRIIDDYLIPGELDQIMSIILVLAGVYLILSISLFLQNYWMIGIAQTTIYKLRTGVFSHLLKLPISFFNKRQHGEIMSRVTNDI